MALNRTSEPINCLFVMKSMLTSPRLIGAATVLLGGLFMISADVAINEPQEELAIGAAAPLADLAMANVDGGILSLRKAAGPNGLLVVFSCNTCPFVVGNGTKSDGWEGRYNATAKEAKSYGVGMVLVNSNEAKRDNHDSMEAMESHAKEQGYAMPYLMDTNSQLADAFGAMKTPHVYLFDSELTLVYRGALDDNVNDADAVENFYARDAMTAVSKGTPCAVSETKAIGCSIKRVH